MRKFFQLSQFYGFLLKTLFVKQYQRPNVLDLNTKLISENRRYLGEIHIQKKYLKDIIRTSIFPPIVIRQLNAFVYIFEDYKLNANRKRRG